MGIIKNLRLTRREKSQSVIIALSFILIMFFQNCSMPEGFQTEGLQNISSSKNSGGSGVGYDGKIGGSYYRFVPDYTCAGQPAAKEIIQVNDDSTKYITNSTLQCGSEIIDLPINKIQTSPLQTEFITFNDNIFKKMDSLVNEIPNELPEVICRDNFENPQLEIVSHYDRIQQTATGRIYKRLSDGSISKSNDFSVARVLSPYEIEYQSNIMKLKVDARNAIPGTRRYNGRYDGQNNEGSDVTCVTGGLLDSSAWPLKLITDFRVTGFTINYYTNSVVITKEDAVGSMAGRRLLQLKPDGQFRDLTSELLNSQYEVNSLTSSYSNTPLILASGVTNLNGSNYLQYFFLDLQNLLAIPFGNAGEVLRSSPAPLQNGEMIYTVNNSQANTILRKLNLKTQQLVDIYQNFDVKAEVIQNTNLVVTVSNSTSRSVLVHNIINNTKQVIDPPIATSCFPSSENDYALDYTYGNPTVFKVFPKANMAVVRYNCYQDNPILYAVSLNNNPNINFGKNACVLDYSTEYNWIEIGHEVLIKQASGLMEPSCRPISAFHYDFNTNSSFSLDGNIIYSADRYKNFATAQMVPMYANAENTQITSNGTTRYSQLKLTANLNLALVYSNAKPQLIEHNLITKQTREICDLSKGSIISLGSMNNGEAYSLNYSSDENVYYVYKIKENLCEQLNSFPSNKSKVQEIALAPTGLGVILSDDTQNTPSSVYFVPFSGKPTYLLNRYEQDIYTASGFKINSNTKELFLRGKAKDNTVDHLYKFTLPDFLN